MLREGARVSAVRLLLLTVALTRLSAQTPAGMARASLPDSPVGRNVSAWLDAFNSGDSLRLAAYYRRYGLVRSLEAQMARRAATGGFDVVSIEKSLPRYLEAVMRERATGSFAYLVSEVAAGNDFEVTQSSIIPMPAGISPASFRIDRATRVRVIESAIGKIDTNYVFPEVATRMADSVRARLKRGEYDNVTNGVTFANLLTRDLRAVSHDLHLAVNFSPGRIPDPNIHRDSARLAQYRRDMERQHCGFVKTERLPGNIGYLKFNFFGDPDVCGPTASAAMSSLAYTDAVIIDLRDNGGGSPEMVAYVCSYLFAARTHLNDLWVRRTGRTQEFWTREVPGKKLREETPVYVLTSARTFSGAEEFAYDLKNRKRATIVGETTGGGAHPVFSQEIDEHFSIGVPYARAINPVTKTDWEGTGVQPDVKAPASEALSVGLKVIADRRRASGPPG